MFGWPVWPVLTVQCWISWVDLLVNLRLRLGVSPVERTSHSRWGSTLYCDYHCITTNEPRFCEGPWLIACNAQSLTRIICSQPFQSNSSLITVSNQRPSGAFRLQGLISHLLDNSSSRCEMWGSGLSSGRCEGQDLNPHSRCEGQDRSSWSIAEGLIENRLVRLARRRDSALTVDQVYLGGPETRIRAGKSSDDAEISVLQGRTHHRNQSIHICQFKVARYFLADSCLNRPSKPCKLSVQRKIQGVSVECFANLHGFWKWDSIEFSASSW